MSSFYTTLTGLSAYRSQITEISNNLANMETTAYKSNSISFEEILADAMTLDSSSSVSTGKGVSVQGTSTSWDQGDLSETGNSLDLAITGDGFFIVCDESGTTYYTRDGSLTCNDEGLLVTEDGMTVQGYAIDDYGDLGSVGDITLSTDTIPAAATSEITTTINLNSGSDVDDTFSSTITTYDSQGNEIPIEITFTKTDADEWDWVASTTAGVVGAIDGNGTLTFTADGALDDGTNNPTITLTLTNGTTQEITWDLYDDSGSSNGTVTQYASESSLSDQEQDGNASGSLMNVSIGDDGVITGTYSNGEVSNLYQIALGLFSNNDGLNKVDDSLYLATSASGTANIGTAGSGQFGTLTSGCLEISNVDMAAEMADLIIAQRAYEACAKLITAESEMLQTTVNMT